MVGDRRYDISGAHANRVRALGVLWGYGSRDELETAGADDLVGDPQDLAAAALALLSS
jgi:phosphoglycolate phosphatase